MKNILFLSLSLFALGLTAQQLPELSQYLNNDYLLNPAIAGTKTYAPATISTRVQWMSFTNAPVTQVGSIHGAITDNVGLGLSIINATAGPTAMTSAQMAYSYRLKICEKMKISFGLAPMIIQQSLQKSKLTLDDANDNTFNRINGKTMIADINAGVHVYCDKYFVSLSVPQVMENKVRMGDALFTEKLRRHFLLFSSYDYLYKEKYVFTPSVLIKVIQGGAPAQFDLNLKATYNQLFWVGLSYRSSTSQKFNESAIAFLGVMKYNFLFGYSFDYSFSSMHSYSAGSHEIFLTYRIMKKVPKVIEANAKEVQ